MLTTVEKMLFLSSVEMFLDIPLDILTAISGIAKEERRGAGEVLFEEGDVGDALYLIISGRVGVKRGSVDSDVDSDGGGDATLLATLGEGECVGEMAILSEEPRSATVETIDETAFLVIDKKSFRVLIRKNPDIAFHIFDILVGRIRDAMDRGGR